jgi:peptidoglycan/xylan/chitin deacetylase (PgdA/CDA1 family)
MLERYADLPRHVWRDRGRQIALSALWHWNGRHRAESVLQRPRVQFLYLHHLFRDEVAPFRALLEALAEQHTFISYSEAVERVLNGPIDRPYVAFSFDDGLKSCRLAGDLLAEFSASACFFVCPEVIGLRDPKRIRAFCEERLRIPPTEFLDWSELEALKADGHEVGAHTINHLDLATLSRSRLEYEIIGSRDLLEARLGPVPHFAWPYGTFRSFSAAAAEVVHAAGFRSCASAERGAHVTPVSGDPASLCIRRDQVLPAEPLHHAMYFCTRSARLASARMNEWPPRLTRPARPPQP